MASVAFAVGASLVGGLLSSAIAPKQKQSNNFDDAPIIKSEYGVPIPKVYGRTRVTGNIFWGEKPDIRKWGSRTVIDGTFGVLLCEGEISQIGRIWLNDELWYDPFSTDPKVLAKSLDRFTQRVTAYLGSEFQPPDPTIQARDGVEPPAFRGLVYLVFRDLGLENYGNVVPKVEVEIVDTPIAPKLSAVVTDLLLRSGLTTNQFSIDLVEDPSVRGFKFSQSGGSIRDALEDLQNIYLFQIVDNGGEILVRDQEQPVFITIPREVQGTRLSGEPAIPLLVEVNAKKEDLPSKVEIEYPNVNREYNRGIQDIFAPSSDYTNDLNFRTEAVLSDTDAQSSCLRLMTLYRKQFKKIEQVKVPLLNFNPIAGDSVAIEIDGATRVCQVDSVTRGTNFISELVLIVSTDNITQLTLVSGLDNLYNQSDSFDLSGNPDTEVIDTNLISDADNELGIYATPVLEDTNSTWTGGSLAGAINGNTFNTLSNLVTNAAYGILASPLPVTYDNLIVSDSTGFVVTLTSGQIDTVSESEFLSNTNVMIVNGELISFKDAVLITPNQYRITNFVRGIRGTQNLITDHVIESEVWFIKNNQASFTDSILTTDYLEKNVEFKSIPSGVLEVDVDSIDTETPFKGLRLKPYSPTNVKLTKSSTNNDILITFHRRTRKDGEWLQASEVVPLNESIEEYTIQFLNDAGDTSLRIITTNTTQYLYTEAQQIEDYGSSVISLSLVMYQQSALVGLGHFLKTGLIKIDSIVSTII